MDWHGDLIEYAAVASSQEWVTRTRADTVQDIMYMHKKRQVSAIQTPLRYPPDGPVVLLPLVLICLSCVWIGWASTVGIRQEALNGGQDGAHIVARRPGLLNDV